ncbi:MAG: hypothetical protein DI629_20515 [Mesorhizobium amorphae]|nr:MAG: hypothetical protein DI629_20515 [Mesorhizobium amorphae]
MPLSRILLAAGFAAAMGGSALAQNAALVELEDNFVVQPWNVSVDALEDADVFGPGGAKIGEVDEVLGTDAATPTALVVDFEDNSNYGRDDRVIPLDQFGWAENKITLTTNPGDISNFPVHTD